MVTIVYKKRQNTAFPQDRTRSPFLHREDHFVNSNANVYPLRSARIEEQPFTRLQPSLSANTKRQEYLNLKKNVPFAPLPSKLPYQNFSQFQSEPIVGASRLPFKKSGASRQHPWNRLSNSPYNSFPDGQSRNSESKFNLYHNGQVALLRTPYQPQSHGRVTFWGWIYQNVKNLWQEKELNFTMSRFSLSLIILGAFLLSFLLLFAGFLIALNVYDIGSSRGQFSTDPYYIEQNYVPAPINMQPFNPYSAPAAIQSMPRPTPEVIHRDSMILNNPQQPYAPVHQNISPQQPYPQYNQQVAPPSNQMTQQPDMRGMYPVQPQVQQMPIQQVPQAGRQYQKYPHNIPNQQGRIIRQNVPQYPSGAHPQYDNSRMPSTGLVPYNPPYYPQSQPVQ